LAIENRNLKIENPVAIVTGAGSGIGRAAAIALAKAGWAVALAGRDRARLEETAGMLSGGVGVLVQPTDITDSAACDALVAATVARFGRIDALANVAGFVDKLQPLSETSNVDWQRIVGVNLSGPFHLTRAVWPTFMKNRRSVIVNVSSMASLDPFEGLGAYAVAKSGLNMLTQVTAAEGKLRGVVSVAIAPGAVETPMLRAMFDTAFLPADQTLDPEEVGALIADCITGKKTFVSGELIVIQP
jgi:NAD(P)-dependent dehydrogenase (short-subunit alcohol dehydrogenase family)